MRRVLLALTCRALLTRQVRAQGLPVIDAPQVAQNVISLANDALNLLPLPVIEIASDLSADITTLNTIIAEGTQVGLDLSSLQAQLTSLFDLHTAPASSSELLQRVTQIRTLVWQARSYAMRVNTLIQSFQNTLRHIDALIGTIAQLVGVKEDRRGGTR